MEQYKFESGVHASTKLSSVNRCALVGSKGQLKNKTAVKGYTLRSETEKTIYTLYCLSKNPVYKNVEAQIKRHRTAQNNWTLF